MRCVAGLLTGGMLALTGCASAEVDPTRFEANAQAVVTALGEGRFDDVTADFDATMQEGLSTAELESVWGELEAEVGPYQGTRDQPKFGSADGAAIVDVPVTFGDEPLKVRISFHEDGRIAGLVVLAPLVALPNQVVAD